MWRYIYIFLLLRFLKRPEDDNQEEKSGGSSQNLPIYIFSGSMDPVGGFGKGVEKLKEMYETHGLKEVSLVLYPEGRHEMLNEINRDEVIEDIVRWLNKILI